MNLTRRCMRFGAALVASVALFVQSFVPASLVTVAAPAAVAMVAAVAVVSPAFAEDLNKFPRTSGGAHENLNFYGSKPKVVNKTAVPQLLVTGEGFLDGICPFRGTLGKYSLALDSGSGASGLSIDSFSLALSPNVYTAVDTTSAQHGMQGCWVPPNGPVKFINGLVGAQSDAGHVTLFYVHCSSGANPCQL